MPKKYKVIVKIANDKFVKYNVDCLISFERFLSFKFPNWRWYNVFCKKSGLQIANYTKKLKYTTIHHNKHRVTL